MSYSYYKNQQPEGGLIRQEVKRLGPVKTIKRAFSVSFEFLIWLLSRKNSFVFKGKRLKYFNHRYNNTWRNERAIEVPIVLNYFRSSKHILEIGNVLKHYISSGHQVLDKYEKGESIINEDIISFKSKKKYDLIVSISTFEHIGIDDFPRDSEKAIKAIKYVIKNLLSKEGSFVITFPINYNTSLSKLPISRLSNYSIFCFKKINFKGNIWVPCNYSDIAHFNHQQPVKGLVVLELNSKTKINA